MLRGLATAFCIVPLWLSPGATAQPAPGEGEPAASQGEGRPLIADDTIKRLLMEGPRGSLAITVTQGTKAGPPISDLELRVDLYHRNDPIYEMIAATDRSGVVLMGDLPVALTVRPVVRAEYGGVSYLEVGPPMSAESPDAVVKLTVYETTETEPVWRVAMRHVLVSRDQAGNIVEETLIVENPGDATWVGGEADERDNRTTVRVSLPEGAADVQLLEGFHGWCCTKHEGRELAVQMPLMPGRTTYRFAYLLPTVEDTTNLQFAAAAPTDRMELFVPDDGSTAEATGVELGGREVIENSPVRWYLGQGLVAGTEAGVRLVSTPSVAHPPAAGGGFGRVSIIVVALVVLGVAGVVVVRMKRA